MILTLGFVLLSPRFIYDALTKGKYAEGFWQRFGFLPAFDRAGKRIIWLHCVSVGETQAARPLARAVLENFPDYRLVVSTTTRTGQRLAREIFKSDAALIFYFPFDWRWVVRRVLRHIKPDAVLIMETEIWFNFLREARRQNVKIAVVNGRLSEKSFKNYNLIRGLMRRILADLDLALMSGAADAERIRALGCAADKVFVTGNVKFDLPPGEMENELTRELRARFQIDDARPLIIAASTHEPEEKLILAAFLKLLETNRAARLLVVPRHPERFDRVADLLEKSDLKFVRRSAPASERDAAAQIVLLDSVGELRAVYRLANLVFVGGSLIPHGGQNILEPAAARRAIVTGFYTMNFAAIVKQFAAENAVVQLPALVVAEIPDALAAAFADLLNNPARRESLAANAAQTLRQNAGATNQTVQLLRKILNA